ncbi:MAG: SRPBCC family protein [Acidimicrobiia bacterium]
MIAHTTTVDAPMDDVWAALQTASTWEGIAGIQGVHDVRHDGDLLEAFDFHIEVAGMRFDGEASVVGRRPSEAMTLRLDSKDLGARLAVRLESNGETRTKLAVGAELLPRSMLVKMAFGPVEKSVRNGLPREVEAFATRLSAGGTV